MFQVGDLLCHCGKMLHGGGQVTHGVRYILVGFVEVLPPNGDEEDRLPPGYIDEKLMSEVPEGDEKDYQALDLHWKCVDPSASKGGDDAPSNAQDGGAGGEGGAKKKQKSHDNDDDPEFTAWCAGVLDDSKHLVSRIVQCQISPAVLTPHSPCSRFDHLTCWLTPPLSLHLVVWYAGGRHH